MVYLSRGIERIGGRRLVLALGGFYVATAAVFPVTSVAGNRSVDGVLIVSLLVGASGLALSYGGYRLPRTDIRPDLYHVVAGWCVRAVEVIVGVLLLVSLVAGQTDPVANLLVLSALASVAGLAMGYHDGRAETRAVDAEEYSRQLERYRSIVETVSDGIFVADADDRFTLVNDAYCEMMGYDREDLIGSPTSLVADETKEDVAAILEEVERDLTTGTSETNTYETSLETASGETIEAEWSVAPLPNRGGGDPERVVVVRDVTERNERERRLERQNEQLDSFASLLAHELRNPVTIGQIYSQRLPREETPTAVDYVADAFDRIEDMIDVMLLVARGRDAISEFSTVSLADAAREAWAEVDAPDATLELDVDQTVEADETYVRHLFRNLFENAVEHGSTCRQPKADDVHQTPSDAAHQKSEISEDAVEHGSTSHRPADDDAVEHGSTNPRSQTQEDAVEHGGADVTVTVGTLPTGFYVADDGRGIDPDERATVFETGYTSAASEGGMGLGLTFVQEMANAYGWKCSVTESDDGGARFEFENATRTPSATE